MGRDVNETLTGDFYTNHFAPGLSEDGDTLILNIGPQHPATHGVLRVIVELDGEYIRKSEPVLGYIHRMHEKMGEVKTYAQYLPNMGRVDYLHALAWNWAYVGAVEKLMGITVPPPNQGVCPECSRRNLAARMAERHFEQYESGEEG